MDRIQNDLAIEAVQSPTSMSDSCQGKSSGTSSIGSQSEVVTFPPDPVLEPYLPTRLGYFIPKRAWESSYHRFCVLKCPNCCYAEFPGCGSHLQLLTLFRSNGHATCVACANECGTDVTVTYNACSTDTSYPWCDSCRECELVPPEPINCVAHDDILPMMNAIYVYEKIAVPNRDMAENIACVTSRCSDCYTLAWRTLNGRLVRFFHSYFMSADDFDRIVDHIVDQIMASDSNDSPFGTNVEDDDPIARRRAVRRSVVLANRTYFQPKLVREAKHLIDKLGIRVYELGELFATPHHDNNCKGTHKPFIFHLSLGEVEYLARSLGTTPRLKLELTSQSVFKRPKVWVTHPSLSGNDQEDEEGRTEEAGRLEEEIGEPSSDEPNVDSIDLEELPKPLRLRLLECALGRTDRTTMDVDPSKVAKLINPKNNTVAITVGEMGEKSWVPLGKPTNPTQPSAYYQLSPMGHPYPIWTNRSFTGHFADPYTRNTALEGGPVVNAILYVSLMGRRVLEHYRHWLVNFSDEDIEILHEALDALREASFLSVHAARAHHAKASVAPAKLPLWAVKELELGRRRNRRKIFEELSIGGGSPVAAQVGGPSRKALSSEGELTEGRESASGQYEEGEDDGQRPPLAAAEDLQEMRRKAFLRERAAVDASADEADSDDSNDSDESEVKEASEAKEKQKERLQTKSSDREAGIFHSEDEDSFDEERHIQERKALQQSKRSTKRTIAEADGKRRVQADETLHPLDPTFSQTYLSSEPTERDVLLVQYVQQFLKRLSDLQVGSYLCFPGGYRKPWGGHAIMHIINRRGEDRYAFITCNSGNGTAYHLGTPKLDGKDVFQTSLCLDFIPKEKISSPAFWLFYFRMLLFPAAEHQVEMLYDVILPFLAGGPLHEKASTEDKAAQVMRSIQLSGTCYFRCVTECIRYIICDRGLTMDHWKVFAVALRVAALHAVALDLETSPALLDNSDVALIRLAARQTVRAAVKLSRRITPWAAFPNRLQSSDRACKSWERLAVLDDQRVQFAAPLTDLPPGCDYAGYIELLMCLLVRIEARLRDLPMPAIDTWRDSDPEAKLADTASSANQLAVRDGLAQDESAPSALRKAVANIRIASRSVAPSLEDTPEPDFIKAFRSLSFDSPIKSLDLEEAYSRYEVAAGSTCELVERSPTTQSLDSAWQFLLPSSSSLTQIDRIEGYSAQGASGSHDQVTAEDSEEDVSMPRKLGEVVTDVPDTFTLFPMFEAFTRIHEQTEREEMLAGPPSDRKDQVEESVGLLELEPSQQPHINEEGLIEPVSVNSSDLQVFGRLVTSDEDPVREAAAKREAAELAKTTVPTDVLLKHAKLLPTLVETVKRANALIMRQTPAAAQQALALYHRLWTADEDEGGLPLPLTREERGLALRPEHAAENLEQQRLTREQFLRAQHQAGEINPEASVRSELAQAKLEARAGSKQGDEEEGQDLTAEIMKFKNGEISLASPTSTVSSSVDSSRTAMTTVDDTPGDLPISLTSTELDQSIQELFPPQGPTSAVVPDPAFRTAWCVWQDVPMTFKEQQSLLLALSKCLHGFVAAFVTCGLDDSDRSASHHAAMITAFSFLVAADAVLRIEAIDYHSPVSRMLEGGMSRARDGKPLTFPIIALNHCNTEGIPFAAATAALPLMSPGHALARGKILAYLTELDIRSDTAIFAFPSIPEYVTEHERNCPTLQFIARVIEEMGHTIDEVSVSSSRNKETSELGMLGRWAYSSQDFSTSGHVKQITPLAVKHPEFTEFRDMVFWVKMLMCPLGLIRSLFARDYWTAEQAVIRWESHTTGVNMTRLRVFGRAFDRKEDIVTKVITNPFPASAAWYTDPSVMAQSQLKGLDEGGDEVPAQVVESEAREDRELLFKQLEFKPQGRKVQWLAGSGKEGRGFIDYDTVKMIRKSRFEKIRANYANKVNELRADILTALHGSLSAANSAIAAQTRASDASGVASLSSAVVEQSSDDSPRASAQEQEQDQQIGAAVGKLESRPTAADAKKMQEYLQTLVNKYIDAVTEFVRETLIESEVVAYEEKQWELGKPIVYGDLDEEEESLEDEPLTGSNLENEEVNAIATGEKEKEEASLRDEQNPSNLLKQARERFVARKRKAFKHYPQEYSEALVGQSIPQLIVRRLTSKGIISLNADVSIYECDAEDILCASNLPTFQRMLTEELAQVLLTNLTEPALRIPLILNFFTGQSRPDFLQSPGLRLMLTHVLFEPHNFIAESTEAKLRITQLPQHPLLSTTAPQGLLWQELKYSPLSTVQSLSAIFDHIVNSSLKGDIASYLPHILSSPAGFGRVIRQHTLDQCRPSGLAGTGSAYFSLQEAWLDTWAQARSLRVLSAALQQHSIRGLRSRCIMRDQVEGDEGTALTPWKSNCQLPDTDTPFGRYIRDALNECATLAHLEPEEGAVLSAHRCSLVLYMVRLMSKVNAWAIAVLRDEFRSWFNTYWRLEKMRARLRDLSESTTLLDQSAVRARVHSMNRHVLESEVLALSNELARRLEVLNELRFAQAVLSSRLMCIALPLLLHWRLLILPTRGGKLSLSSTEPHGQAQSAEVRPPGLALELPDSNNELRTSATPSDPMSKLPEGSADPRKDPESESQAIKNSRRLIRALSLHAHIVYIFRSHIIQCPDGDLDTMPEKLPSISQEISSSTSKPLSRPTGAKLRRIYDAHMPTLTTDHVAIFVGAFTFFTTWHLSDGSQEPDYDPSTVSSAPGRRKRRGMRKRGGKLKKVNKSSKSQKKAGGSTGFLRVIDRSTKAVKEELAALREKAAGNDASLEDDPEILNDSDEAWSTLCPYSHADLYEIYQSRVALVHNWLKNADPVDRDYVLSVSVKWTQEPFETVVTTSHGPSASDQSVSESGSKSTGTSLDLHHGQLHWKPSSHVGEYVVDGSTATFVLPLGRVLAHGKGIESIPSEVASSPEFQTALGSTRLLASRLPPHANLEKYQIFGSNVTLAFWQDASTDLPLIGNPRALPKGWMKDFGEKRISMGSKQILQQLHSNYDWEQRVGDPELDGIEYSGNLYTRRFGSEPMRDCEIWAARLLDTHFDAIYHKGKRKLRFTYWLPHDPIPETAKCASLIGYDRNSGTWRLLVLNRRLSDLHMYTFIEHGRVAYPVLVYASRGYLANVCLSPDEEDSSNENSRKRKNPIRMSPIDQSQQLIRELRYAAGDPFATVVNDRTLVIDRVHNPIDPHMVELLQREVEADGDVYPDPPILVKHFAAPDADFDLELPLPLRPPPGRERFVPPTLLTGLIPDALRLNFRFWQSLEDNVIRGLPIHPARNVLSSTSKSFCFGLVIRIVDLATVVSSTACPMSVNPTIHALEQHARYTAVIHRLPLTREAMTVQGAEALQESLSGSSGSYNLPWWAYDEAVLVNPNISASSDRIDSLQLPGSLTEQEKDGGAFLARLTDCLTRIEDMSSILIWAKPSSVISLASLPIYQLHGDHPSESDVVIALATTKKLFLDRSFALATAISRSRQFIDLQSITLTRLDLEFDFSKGIRKRLICRSQAGLTISDSRPKALKKLTADIPCFLVLETALQQLVILVPSYPVERLEISTSPFTTQIVEKRSDKEWEAIGGPRYYLFPLHHTQTQLRPTSLAAAARLLLLRMLTRRYDEAADLVDACFTDTPLSVHEAWAIKQLEKTINDMYPDAIAIRLKLVACLLLMPDTVVWYTTSVETGKGVDTNKPYSLVDDLVQYISRVRYVTARCRLDPLVEERLISAAKASWAAQQEQQDAPGGGSDLPSAIRRRADVLAECARLPQLIRSPTGHGLARVWQAERDRLAAHRAWTLLEDVLQRCAIRERQEIEARYNSTSAGASQEEYKSRIEALEARVNALRQRCKEIRTKLGDETKQLTFLEKLLLQDPLNAGPDVGEKLLVDLATPTSNASQMEQLLQNVYAKSFPVDDTGNRSVSAPDITLAHPLPVWTEDNAGRVVQDFYVPSKSQEEYYQGAFLHHGEVPKTPSDEGEEEWTTVGSFERILNDACSKLESEIFKSPSQNSMFHGEPGMDIGYATHNTLTDVVVGALELRKRILDPRALTRRVKAKEDAMGLREVTDRIAMEKRALPSHEAALQAFLSHSEAGSLQDESTRISSLAIMHPYSEENTKFVLTSASPVGRQGFNPAWRNWIRYTKQYLSRYSIHYWRKLMTYDRPTRSQLTGAGVSATLARLITDSLEGSVRKLGFIFFLDLLSGNVKVDIEGDYAKVKVQEEIEKDLVERRNFALKRARLRALRQRRQAEAGGVRGLDRPISYQLFAAKPGEEYAQRDEVPGFVRSTASDCVFVNALITDDDEDLESELDSCDKTDAEASASTPSKEHSDLEGLVPLFEANEHFIPEGTVPSFNSHFADLAASWIYMKLTAMGTQFWITDVYGTLSLIAALNAHLWSPSIKRFDARFFKSFALQYAANKQVWKRGVSLHRPTSEMHKIFMRMIELAKSFIQECGMEWDRSFSSRGPRLFRVETVNPAVKSPLRPADSALSVRSISLSMLPAELQLPREEFQALLTQPLFSARLPDYVGYTPADESQLPNSKLPFDLWKHPQMQSDHAQKMLQRLQDDLAEYVSLRTSAQRPQLHDLLPEKITLTIAELLGTTSMTTDGTSVVGSDLSAYAATLVAPLDSISASLNELIRKDENYVIRASAVLDKLANKVSLVGDSLSELFGRPSEHCESETTLNGLPRFPSKGMRPTLLGQSTRKYRLEVLDWLEQMRKVIAQIVAPRPRLQSKKDTVTLGSSDNSISEGFKQLCGPQAPHFWCTLASESIGLSSVEVAAAGYLDVVPVWYAPLTSSESAPSPQAFVDDAFLTFQSIGAIARPKDEMVAWLTIDLVSKLRKRYGVADRKPRQEFVQALCKLWYNTTMTLKNLANKLSSMRKAGFELRRLHKVAERLVAVEQDESNLPDRTSHARIVQYVRASGDSTLVDDFATLDQLRTVTPEALSMKQIMLELERRHLMLRSAYYRTLKYRKTLRKFAKVVTRRVLRVLRLETLTSRMTTLLTALSDQITTALRCCTSVLNVWEESRLRKGEYLLERYCGEHAVLNFQNLASLALSTHAHEFNCRDIQRYNPYFNPTAVSSLFAVYTVMGLVQGRISLARRVLCSIRASRDKLLTLVKFAKSQREYQASPADEKPVSGSSHPEDVLQPPVLQRPRSLRTVFSDATKSNLTLATLSAQVIQEIDLIAAQLATERNVFYRGYPIEQVGETFFSVDTSLPQPVIQGRLTRTATNALHSYVTKEETLDTTPLLLQPSTLIRFDPRFFVFELDNDIILRRQQVLLVGSFLDRAEVPSNERSDSGSCLPSGGQKLKKAELPLPPLHLPRTKGLSLWEVASLLDLHVHSGLPRILSRAEFVQRALRSSPMKSFKLGSRLTDLARRMIENRYDIFVRTPGNLNAFVLRASPTQHLPETSEKLVDVSSDGSLHPNFEVSVVSSDRSDSRHVLHQSQRARSFAQHAFNQLSALFASQAVGEEGGADVGQATVSDLKTLQTYLTGDQEAGLQVKLSASNRVHQLIMGAGKTTVVAPLLSLCSDSAIPDWHLKLLWVPPSYHVVSPHFIEYSAPGQTVQGECLSLPACVQREAGYVFDESLLVDKDGKRTADVRYIPPDQDSQSTFYQFIATQHHGKRMRRLISIVVPPALQYMTVQVMRSRFTGLLKKTIFTFKFERDEVMTALFVSTRPQLQQSGPDAFGQEGDEGEVRHIPFPSSLIKEKSKALTAEDLSADSQDAELSRLHSHKRRDPPKQLDLDDGQVEQLHARLPMEMYLDKLRMAVEVGGVLVSNDTSIKSCMLKFIECRHELEYLSDILRESVEELPYVPEAKTSSDGATAVATTRTDPRIICSDRFDGSGIPIVGYLPQRSRETVKKLIEQSVKDKNLSPSLERNHPLVRSAVIHSIFPRETKKLIRLTEVSEKLREGLTLLLSGTFIMDEVDLLLHPLKSELNFPIGSKRPILPSPIRWIVPIVFFEVFELGVELARQSLAWSKSRRASMGNTFSYEGGGDDSADQLPDDGVTELVRQFSLRDKSAHAATSPAEVEDEVRPPALERAHSIDEAELRESLLSAQAAPSPSPGSKPKQVVAAAGGVDTVMTGDSLESLVAITRGIARGIRQRAIMLVPHSLLLSHEFYYAELLPHMARRLLVFLRSCGVDVKDESASRVKLPKHRLVPLRLDKFVTKWYTKDSTDDFVPVESNALTVAGQQARTEEDDEKTFGEVDTLLAYIVDEGVHASDQGQGAGWLVQEHVAPEYIALLNLTRDWLISYGPHCLSKMNRVSYGLLPPGWVPLGSDSSDVVAEQSKARKLAAVPFVAKDVPSRSSEFAHPDILAGLTYRAYRIQGLRKSDLRNMLISMKMSHHKELGPEHKRKSYTIFKSWVQKYEAQFSSQGSQSISSHFGASLTLPSIQPNDPAQLARLHAMFAKLPVVVEHYVLHYVLSQIMYHQELNLSASGCDLASPLVTQKLGFSGTPSELLPMSMGPCLFERGSEGQIVALLSSPHVVALKVLPFQWTVDSILAGIATAQNPPLHALIDTGALITGLSNFETAQRLLELGLDHVDGVVYIDEGDQPQVLLRSGAVVAFSQCGLPLNRRFTFYDQIHTVGIDIAQPPTAVAAITLGKDMTLRDYAQGAFRMRGIGIGQKLQVIIIPEIARIINNVIKSDQTPMPIEASAAPGPAADVSTPVTRTSAVSQSLLRDITITDVLGWLVTAAVRQERLQLIQLLKQDSESGARAHALAFLMRQVHAEEWNRDLSEVTPLDSALRFVNLTSEGALRFRQEKQLLLSYPKPERLHAATMHHLAVGMFWEKIDESLLAHVPKLHSNTLLKGFVRRAQLYMQMKPWIGYSAQSSTTGSSQQARPRGILSPLYYPERAHPAVGISLSAGFTPTALSTLLIIAARAANEGALAMASEKYDQEMVNEQEVEIEVEVVTEDSALDFHRSEVIEAPWTLPVFLLPPVMFASCVAEAQIEAALLHAATLKAKQNTLPPSSSSPSPRIEEVKPRDESAAEGPIKTENTQTSEAVVGAGSASSTSTQSKTTGSTPGASETGVTTGAVTKLAGALSQGFFALRGRSHPPTSSGGPLSGGRMLGSHLRAKPEFSFDLPQELTAKVSPSKPPIQQVNSQVDDAIRALEQRLAVYRPPTAGKQRKEQSLAALIRALYCEMANRARRRQLTTTPEVEYSLALQEAQTGAIPSPYSVLPFYPLHEFSMYMCQTLYLPGGARLSRRFYSPLPIARSQRRLCDISVVIDWRFACIAPSKRKASWHMPHEMNDKAFYKKQSTVVKEQMRKDLEAALALLAGPKNQSVDFDRVASVLHTAGLKSYAHVLRGKLEGRGTVELSSLSTVFEHMINICTNPELQPIPEYDSYVTGSELIAIDLREAAALRKAIQTGALSDQCMQVVKVLSRAIVAARDRSDWQSQLPISAMLLSLRDFQSGSIIETWNYNLEEAVAHRIGDVDALPGARDMFKAFVDQGAEKLYKNPYVATSHAVLRFFNGDMFYSKYEVAQALHTLAFTDPSQRLAFFQRTLECRNREKLPTPTAITGANGSTSTVQLPDDQKVQASSNSQPLQASIGLSSSALLLTRSRSPAHLFTYFCSKLALRTAIANSGQNVLQLFQQFDKSGNGFLSRYDLIVGLRSLPGLEELDEGLILTMLQEYDIDADGVLNFAEYTELVQPGEE